MENGSFSVDHLIVTWECSIIAPLFLVTPQKENKTQ